MTVTIFNNILKSPLDQFDTFPIWENIWQTENELLATIGLFIYPYSWSNALVITTIFCYSTLVFFKFFYTYTRIKRVVIFKRVLRGLFKLVREIVIPIGLTRKQFLSFATFLFLSIFSKNSYSQLPAFKAVTATVQLPFTYSITCCIGFNLLYLLRNKPVESFGFFLPGAIPLEMSPFLWIIEFISHLIKFISLAVRLCANIFSGHVLLDIILTALFLVLTKGGGALFIIFLMFQAVGFAIQLLETFIGFLQAFVFLTLTSVYTGEMFHADH
jgi:F-type H+-transporting ATPase subunit a